MLILKYEKRIQVEFLIKKDAELKDLENSYHYLI